MPFKSGIAEKSLRQRKSGNPIGNDLESFLGDRRADDLTKLTKSSLSRLRHSGNIRFDGVSRCLVGERVIL